MHLTSNLLLHYSRIPPASLLRMGLLLGQTQLSRALPQLPCTAETSPDEREQQELLDEAMAMVSGRSCF